MLWYGDDGGFCGVSDGGFCDGDDGGFCGVSKSVPLLLACQPSSTFFGADVHPALLHFQLQHYREQTSHGDPSPPSALRGA
jgi:hypothetical protein